MKNGVGKIKIVEVPLGPYPLEIRKKWVGLTLPCTLVGRDSSDDVRQVYRVPCRDAIDVLEEAGKTEAVKYWRELRLYTNDHFFSFGIDQAEVIEEPPRQRTILVTDEMQGHPHR